MTMILMDASERERARMYVSYVVRGDVQKSLGRWDERKVHGVRRHPNLYVRVRVHECMRKRD